MKIIELSGDVGWEITAKGLKNRLPKDNSDVRLKIDSFGGSVFEGVRLYNVINDYQGKITSELGAIAASAASFFPLASDRIEVRKNTTFMGHKAWSIAFGNSDDMMLEAEILDGLDNIIATAYAKKNGVNKTEILENMKNEFWLFGDDIINAGFADGIVEGSEGSESEESEPEAVEKSEAVARLAQIKSRMQSDEQYNEEMKRAASVFADKKNTIESNILPLADNNKLETEETGMTLKEYLEKYPDAKAEIDVSVNSAVDKELENKIAEDRERSAKVLKLAGVNDEIINSVKNGQTSGDYAEAELTRQREANAKALENGDNQDLGSFAEGNQLPNDTKPETKVDAENKKEDEAFDAFIKSKKGAK